MSLLEDRKIVTREFLLCALYNGSRPLGMGIISAVGAPFTLEDKDAKKLLEEGDKFRPERGSYFDYLYGRPLKTLIPADPKDIPTIRRDLYERDNGSMERALEAELDRRTQYVK